MKQLGQLDSAFINLENTTTPQHIGGLGIYDPSTAPDGFVRFKDLIANFEQRLNTLPLFRTRVVNVPGKIDRPYWVEDKNFDVEFHLRHISLPHPGDWRQLWIQVARLHARSLDMSRPLWEAYVIEGLDNIADLPKGSFAIYTKMHHSLVDGGGSQSFMSALHDLVANPEPLNTSEQPRIVADRQPSQSELLLKSLGNNAKDMVRVPLGIAKTSLDLAKFGLRIAREEIPAPEVTAPKTRFNNPVGPHRVAEAANFSLADFKLIKKAVGITINDVALAIIGGAMRKYLTHYDELPEESLCAGIPLNMRTRGGGSEENNQVGATFMALHSNIAEPVARMQAVHRSAKDAKEASEGNPMVQTLRVAGAFSPWLTQTAASLWQKNNLSKHIPLNISTVVSNVAGPTFPMYSAGAKLVRYHGLGLLTPGCGAFHLVYSNDGLITLTVLADRAIIPDPVFYRQCLEEAFGECKAAAILYANPIAAKKAKTATKKKPRKTVVKPAAKMQEATTTKKKEKKSPTKATPKIASKAKRAPRSKTKQTSAK